MTYLDILTFFGTILGAVIVIFFIISLFMDCFFWYKLRKIERKWKRIKEEKEIR